MMEVGPWRVDGKGGLKFANGGWEEYTTMVFGASLSCLEPTTVAESHILLSSRSAGRNGLLLRPFEQIRSRTTRGEPCTSLLTACQ